MRLCCGNRPARVEHEVTRQWANRISCRCFFPSARYICNTNLLFVVLVSTEIENVTGFAGLKGSFYRHIEQEKEGKHIHNAEPFPAPRW